MSKDFKEFLNFCDKTKNASYGQNLQDLWAIWENSNNDPENSFFVEFGALGGINVSNSFLLEQLGWNGIVAEPHPNYKRHLEKNRSCHKCYDAVYGSTGEELNFKIYNKFPARSTISNFERSEEIKNLDVKDNYREVIVHTISLEDLLNKFNAPKLINFISIDTEGSEYEIIKNFDFTKYQFKSLCIEYGTDENRELIYSLLTKNGYVRKWTEFSEHDDWYVLSELEFGGQREVDILTSEVLNHDHSMMPRAKKRHRVKLQNFLNRSEQIGVPSKSRGLAYRLDLTLKCKDSEYIPKVENAGEVYVENDRSIQIMHNGVKVLANGYIGPWMTKLITELKGHHEPQEEVVFHEVLKLINKDSPVMIEMGCYWAYYSCWFKSKYPNGKAICAEPHKNNLKIGKSNVELNNFSDVNFHHAFAGKYERVKRLILNDEKKVFSTEFLSVKDLIDIHSLRHIDVLHLDIQGAETDVIEDTLELFKQGKITFLIVSTHVHYISGDPLTHQKCVQLIKEGGGRIIVEHEVHESFSGDGLIAACFDESISLPEINISYCRYSESFYRNPLYDVKV